MTWKRYRIVRNDSIIYPWKIQERITLFFFLHWWSTPQFAPPHLFENPDKALIYVSDEGVKGATISVVSKISKIQ